MEGIARTGLIASAMLFCLAAQAQDAAKQTGEDTKSKNATAGNASNTANYHLIRKVKLGGDGGWDYLSIDSNARRLYIGRSNRVMVVDIDNDKLVGEIAGMEGVHGITVVPEFKRGFITCGKENLVRVFDLEKLTIESKIPTGTKPDASVYDPYSKRVFIFNNEGGTATVIDASSAKLAGTIELGGEPESGVADGKGKVFVNLEDKSKIAVIDTKKLKLSATWSLAPGEEPTGLAFDSKHRRLFSGCHNKLMMVLDADTGKIISSEPIGKGVDAAGFDEESQNAFASNGDGTLTVVHESDAKTFAVAQNVETQSGARTMAVDSKKHQIWLVSATPKEEAAGEASEAKGGHHRRQYQPDSFTAIVVGK